MKVPDSSQLYQAVLRKKPLFTKLGDIDHSKLFMPEKLTQLYHIPAYTWLTPPQRLRYNQLFAMRSIEQLMTLEAYFIAMVLKRAKKSAHIKSNQELIFCMEEMAKEEEQHYAMFLSLNKHAEPDLYQQNDMYFAKMSLFERTSLGALAKTPGILLFLLWILLVLEEFSTCISKQMLQNNNNDAETLETNFVHIHREHLKDESRHVAICAHLLSTLIKETSRTTIRLNIFILNTFMREYMTPKRGGLRVIEKLVQEFPELHSRQEEINAAIKNQKQDKVIFDAIQDPKLMPYSHSLFQLYPEFRFYEPVHA